MLRPSKYRAIIAIIFIIITPPILNWALSRPAFCRIVGTDADWLSFYGGYIGSVITSIITLYVLHKQLRQNHDENEQNRVDNQCANKDNRLLQLNILKYEQEKRWLQEIRTACISNTNAYNHNDVKEVCHSFMYHPTYEDISFKIKTLIDRLDQTDTAIGFLMPTTHIDHSSRVFNNKRIQAYKDYNRIIEDIQNLARFINMDYVTIKVVLMSCSFSSDLREMIDENIVSQRITDPQLVNIALADIALQRANKVLSIRQDIRDNAKKYLHKQENRINKIVIDNLP